MLDQRSLTLSALLHRVPTLGIYDHFCGGEVCAICYSFFAWFLLSAFCQINYAGLGGTISDPQGKAFAGADILLTSSSTQAVRHVTSSEQGSFEITGLQPGDYELKVAGSWIFYPRPESAP